MIETSTVPCRACAAPVDPRLASCPACSALRPAQQVWKAEGYEWKTGAQWMGEPLIHVAFGNGPDGRPRVARGLIAIGQRAVGGVAIGILAGGIVAIGVVAAGVFSCGVVAVALAVACGVNAIGPVAFGVTAVGIMAGGVAPIGLKPFP